jgi:hypothetical protein
MHLLCRWHRHLCFLLLSADAAVSSCLSTAEVGWLVVLAVPCVLVVALVVLAAAFVFAGVVAAPAAVPAAFVFVAATNVVFFPVVWAVR